MTDRALHGEAVDAAAIQWIEANAAALRGYDWYLARYGANCAVGLIRCRLPDSPHGGHTACPLSIRHPDGPASPGHHTTLATALCLPDAVALALVEAADGGAGPVRAALERTLLERTMLEGRRPA